MKITRSTLRADGRTVGQAMDSDAAFLRSQGFNAPDGALALDERREAFQERMRQAVLDAMDGQAMVQSGDLDNGPKDWELGVLFKAIDPIAERIFNQSVGL